MIRYRLRIARCYWTYDVPAGEARGGHSHKEAKSLLVAVNGCFNVNLFDGDTWMTYTLNRPYEGLYIPQAIGVRSIILPPEVCVWS